MSLNPITVNPNVHSKDTNPICEPKSSISERIKKFFLAFIRLASKPQEESPTVSTDKKTPTIIKAPQSKIVRCFLRTLGLKPNFDEIPLDDSKNKLYLGAYDPADRDPPLPKGLNGKEIQIYVPKQSEKSDLKDQLDTYADEIRNALNSTYLYVGSKKKSDDLSSIAIATYLIKHKKYSAQDAVQLIKNSRPESNIEKKLESLCDYKSGLDEENKKKKTQTPSIPPYRMRHPLQQTH